MSSKSIKYEIPSSQPFMVKEGDIEDDFIQTLVRLKYTHRPDIHDRAELESNFREKFQQLNAVTLSDSEFARLLDTIITPDVFKSAQTLRNINDFERDDGTPLNFTLVNIADWCKNDFEVVSQLRINTRNSHHRYDVILLINGIPCAQIELKTLGISPRRAMQQIVDYKADPGNGYTNSLLAFMQIFIVSNRTNTYYFANNNNRHFAFDAKERYLPAYQFADRNNQKINHLNRFAETFLPKCTLGHMISRYMVLIASEQKLMMMRPYPGRCPLLPGRCPGLTWRAPSVLREIALVHCIRLPAAPLVLREPLSSAPKGPFISAQGNALGIPCKQPIALKGRSNPWPNPS